MILLATGVQAAEIEIGPGVCDTLVNYVEPPGVEYQPGVDASGNPVAPADVGGTPQVKLPQHIVIPITDYLASRLQGASGTATPGAATTGNTTAPAVPGGIVQPQVLLGTVTLDGTHLAFNGQPLNSDVDGELGELCQKALKGVR